MELLHAEVDIGDGPTVAFLHGFTQTAASWRPVTAPLPHRAVRIDLPGHGGSGAHRGDLPASAAMVGATIARHSGPDGRPILVGYSLGGRVALRTALDHPREVGALVLIGATAGIDDPEERRARRAADDALAQRLEHDGVDAFLDAWLAQPLFAGLQPSPEDLAARRANTVEGLSASLRLAGTGTMDPPWWSELGTLQIPTLVLWGEHDAKFAALGRRLVEAIPDARGAEIEGAGHAAHLQRPDQVVAHLRDLVVRVRG